jgi:hypothetical protein
MGLVMEVPVTDEDGHVYRRDLGDGRTVFVDALTYGRGRINVGPSGSLVYDDGW